jgi:hypothetical protein
VRRVAVIALAAALTGLLVGVVIAALDEDDSSRGPVTAPELTVPRESGVTDTQTDTHREQGATGPPGSGGSEPATPGSTNPTGGAQAPDEDTPKHNTAPPPGSPADRFEKFCEQNPGAC